MFHFSKNQGHLPFALNLISSCIWVLYSLEIANFQLIHYYSGWPAGRLGGWVGSQMLDKAKIKLTQPSLVELGLVLSFAKNAMPKFSSLNSL
jgi:hypothetical protein